MSNSLSIADVTAALSYRLTHKLQVQDPGLSGVNITTFPLDKALDNNTSSDGHQLNIFLYHLVLAPTWRNQSIPKQLKGGETGYPPLGLTLHYLISAYGEASDDVAAHRILGAAMAILHDAPLFTQDELRLALAPDSDLYQQVEHVRITEQPLSIEEMYKLWSAFQTHYRVSAAYEVSVVLIGSSRPAKAPLPALGVTTPSLGLPGSTLTGAFPTIDLAPAYPTISALTPPSPRSYALHGDTLVISGYHLTDIPNVTVTAQLSHPVLASPIGLATTASAPDLTVSLTDPDASTPLPAGVYTLSLLVTYALGADDAPLKPPIITNELPFTLAPEIISFPSSSIALSGGSATVPIQVRPEVVPGQRVFLLLGDQSIPAPPITTATDTLSFTAAVSPGHYYLRVRVDGVDSALIDPAAATPSFTSAPRVTITAS